MIWPEEENDIRDLVNKAMKRGGKYFVLNAPFQTIFFRRAKGLKLWAGPFCNIANAFAIRVLSSMGFSGVIVSPELGKEDYMTLAKESPLPLGIVISGNWPLCISRTKAEDIDTKSVFTSPKSENAWVMQYENDFWVFPNWKLDIRTQKNMLFKAGYRLFVHLVEPVPRDIKLKKRPGLWNWDLSLK